MVERPALRARPHRKIHPIIDALCRQTRLWTPACWACRLLDKPQDLPHYGCPYPCRAHYAKLWMPLPRRLDMPVSRRLYCS